MSSASRTKRTKRPGWKEVMQLALSNGACKDKNCTFNGCRIYQIAKANARKR